MKKISTFIMGMLVGGLLLWTALNYHVIHAPDGLHLVPKISASLSNVYFDARGLTPLDWAEHLDVAAAIRRSNNQQLIDSVMDGALDSALDRWLPPRGSTPSPGD